MVSEGEGGGGGGREVCEKEVGEEGEGVGEGRRRRVKVRDIGEGEECKHLLPLPTDGLVLQTAVCTTYLLHTMLHLLGPTTVASDTCLCLVRVRGVYPTLTVTDIQGEGSATPYSKAHLWNMLGIDRCAAYLSVCTCV